MEKVTNYVSLITEIDELAGIVKHSGIAALANSSATMSVSRLMGYYRRMNKSDAHGPQLKGLAVSKHPDKVGAALSSFRKFLVHKLDEANLSLGEAREMGDWAKECKKTMDRLNVHVMGLGVHASGKDKLVDIGVELGEKGGMFLRKKREKGKRLPLFIARGIKRQREELMEALEYVQKTKKQQRSIKLPQPIVLKKMEYPGIPVISPSSSIMSVTSQLSLTQRRKQRAIHNV